jgi:hypothetical protein
VCPPNQRRLVALRSEANTAKTLGVADQKSQILG